MSGFIGNLLAWSVSQRLVVLFAHVDVALGAFLASSDSENADVECFSSVDGAEVVDVAGCTFLTFL